MRPKPIRAQVAGSGTGLIGKVPPLLSLCVTFGLLAGGVLLSLFKTRTAAKEVKRVE